MVPILWLLATILVALSAPAVLACTFGLATLDWYFPGDSPWFDLALIHSLPLALVGLILTALSFRSGGLAHRGHFPRGLTIAIWLTSLIPAITVCISAPRILFRHGSAWNNLRAAIRSTAGLILLEGIDPHSPVSRDKFEYLRSKYLPHPRPVDLGEHGVVHLRMMQTIYPYVGVDFGNGSNAVLDPSTLLCLYSD